MAFFTISTSKGTISDPHWLNVTYFSLLLLLANYLVGLMQKGGEGKVLKATVFSLAINYSLLAVLLGQIYFSILPIPFKADSSNKVVAWTETAEELESLIDEKLEKRPEFVISREYQLAGALSLYLSFQPLSHAIEKPERNLWSPVDQVIEEGAILVCPPDECEKVLRKAKKRFKRNFSSLGTIETNKHNKLIRRLKIFTLEKNSPI